MTPLADALLSVLPKNVLPGYLERWIVGETPLSTWPVVTTVLASYLAIIFGTQELMRDRSPQPLNTLFRIHNAFLSVGSLVLLALMVEEVASILFSSSIFDGICSEQSWTPVSCLKFTSRYSQEEIYHNITETRILLYDQLLLQIHRASRYGILGFEEKASWYVLSLFIMCQPSPFTFCRLAFLHVFHHSATALLCFTQLNGKTSIVSPFFTYFLPELKFYVVMGRNLAQPVCSRHNV